MEVITDFPERIRKGTRLYLGDEYMAVTVQSLRGHHHGLLVSFREIEGQDAIGQYRNVFVFVRATDRPTLPEGEYYHHELIGLLVVEQDDRELGTLSGILETGANDVYVVKTPEGREVLLPAIESVILDIDLADRRMRVHLLPGLLE